MWKQEILRLEGKVFLKFIPSAISYIWLWIKPKQNTIFIGLRSNILILFLISFFFFFMASKCHCVGCLIGISSGKWIYFKWDHLQPSSPFSSPLDACWTSWSLELRLFSSPLDARWTSWSLEWDYGDFSSFRDFASWKINLYRLILSASICSQVPDLHIPAEYLGVYFTGNCELVAEKKYQR